MFLCAVFEIPVFSLVVTGFQSAILFANAYKFYQYESKGFILSVSGIYFNQRP